MEPESEPETPSTKDSSLISLIDELWCILDPAEDAYEQHLVSVLRHPKSRHVQPWELSPVLTPHRILPQLPRHQIGGGHPAPAPLPTASSPLASAGLQSHVGPKAKAPGKTWRAKLSENRLAALVKWEKIIESHPSHFDLMAEASKDPNCAAYTLHDILSDIFSVKASSALHSRSGPLLRFIKFCRETGVEPFPVKEGLIYRFLKEYCILQAPTFASSLLSSLAFCHHLLGLHFEGNALSPRVTGAARGLFLEKRKLVQKPPLTASMVTSLENIVHGEGDFSFADRYAAGCFLFAVFARARFSDMQGSGIMTEDVTTTTDGPKGYLESSVTRTKTAHTLERKTRYLAMCAPVQGLTTDSWALAWRELARNEGPTIGVDRPLLPAPVESGGWQEAPISVEAGGRWLRSLLYRSGQDPSAVRALGTHSMKATLLSWCAKWGLAKELRMTLGYHSSSRSDSDVVYGRDNVAPALRALEPILEAIAMKRFKPDSTRSGMFEGLREPETRPEDDEISLSSEGSEDEENKDFAAEDEAVDAVVGRWEPSEGLRDFLERAPVYRHSITRFLHVVASEEGTHFKCGRRISTSYAICESLPDVLFPVRKQCCPDVKTAEIGGEGDVGL